MSSLGSCHEPPNNYISLGRCGAGRVFMRYFGASGSLIHCRYCGGAFHPFSRDIATCVTPYSRSNSSFRQAHKILVAFRRPSAD